MKEIPSGDNSGRDIPRIVKYETYWAGSRGGACG